MIDKVIEAKKTIQEFDKLSHDEMFAAIENYTGKTVSKQFKKEWNMISLANRDVLDYIDFIEESLFIEDADVKMPY